MRVRETLSISGTFAGSCVGDVTANASRHTPFSSRFILKLFLVLFSFHHFFTHILSEKINSVRLSIRSMVLLENFWKIIINTKGITSQRWEYPLIPTAFFISCISYILTITIIKSVLLFLLTFAYSVLIFVRVSTHFLFFLSALNKCRRERFFLYVFSLFSFFFGVRDVPCPILGLLSCPC